MTMTWKGYLTRNCFELAATGIQSSERVQYGPGPLPFMGQEGFRKWAAPRLKKAARAARRGMVSGMAGFQPAFAGLNRISLLNSIVKIAKPERCEGVPSHTGERANHQHQTENRTTVTWLGLSLKTLKRQRG